MNNFEVVISQYAEEDLTSIADYFEFILMDVRRGMHMIQHIKTAIFSLEAMPERHPLINDVYLSGKGIRYFPIDRYIIFYTVNIPQRKVNIIRVLYEKREWKTLLRK